MCQHKSTIRLVRCYRWRSPLRALNVKNEQEKQEESNTHTQDNLCNFAPMISPLVTGWEQLHGLQVERL